MNSTTLLLDAEHAADQSDRKYRNPDHPAFDHIGGLKADDTLATVLEKAARDVQRQRDIMAGDYGDNWQHAYTGALDNVTDDTLCVTDFLGVDLDWHDWRDLLEAQVRSSER